MRWGSPQQDPNCSPLYLDHGDTLPGAGELPKELPKEVMGVSAGSVHPLRYLLVPSHPTPLLADSAMTSRLPAVLTVSLPVPLKPPRPNSAWRPFSSQADFHSCFHQIGDESPGDC